MFASLNCGLHTPGLMIMLWCFAMTAFFTTVLVWLQPATKAPRGRPSPCQGVEENGKKQAETGGSG